MPSDNLKIVMDQFTPDILGLFWVTNEELDRDLLGFDEFNYLFDGLISQYLYGQKEINTDLDLNKTNIFFTNNFNNRIFLAHIKSHTGIAGVIDEHFALIQNDKSSVRKTILLFNTTSKDLSSDLQRRYPHFEFKTLVLSK